MTTPTPHTQMALWRWHKGLTQTQLAEAADVGINTIFRMEHGQSIATPKTVVKVAKALGIDVEVFLDALINDFVDKDSQQQMDAANVVQPIRKGADGERNNVEAAGSG